MGILILKSFLKSVLKVAVLIKFWKVVLYLKLSIEPDVPTDGVGA